MPPNSLKQHNHTPASNTPPPNNSAVPVKPSTALHVPQPELPPELGKYVARDTLLLKKLGWTKFVQQRRGRGDLGPLSIQHPVSYILSYPLFCQTNWL